MKTAMKRLLTAALTFFIAQAAFAGIAIEHWQTSNGVRVYFIPARSLPMLDVQLDFGAGSMFDPEGKSGVAALTRSILDLGAGERDEGAIAEQLADIGAIMGGNADTDRASITLRTLSDPDKLGPALAILRDILSSPRFDADILNREKNRTIASIKDAMTRPDAIAGKAFWAAMYPRHPYGRQSSPESVASIAREDIVAFHQRLYNSANASLTLVGDLSREEAERVAEKLGSAIPAGEAPALPSDPQIPKSVVSKLPHPASQAHIYIGVPSIQRGHRDYFPLLVGNYTLGGGGFVSRLVKEVRDKRGFAYSVYSYVAPLRQAGPFQIGLQTQRKQASEAIKVVRNVLSDFSRSGPSAEELLAAKANLTGSFPLRLDSNAKLLANVAMIGFYGLPLDYLEQYQKQVEAVTVDDIKRAFSRHVQAADLVTVTVAAD